MIHIYRWFLSIQSTYIYNCDRETNQLNAQQHCVVHFCFDCIFQFVCVFFLFYLYNELWMFCWCWHINQYETQWDTEIIYRLASQNRFMCVIPVYNIMRSVSPTLFIHTTRPMRDDELRGIYISYMYIERYGDNCSCCKVKSVPSSSS